MQKIVIAAGLLIMAGISGCILTGTKQTLFTEQISESVFTVTFCGNAYMAQKEVDRYAMQRASQLALEKGFTHFVVLKKNDESETCLLKDAPFKQSVVYETGTRGRTPTMTEENAYMFKPNVTLKIRCYKQKDAPEGAIDAQKFLSEQFPGLEFPTTKP